MGENTCTVGRVYSTLYTEPERDVIAHGLVVYCRSQADNAFKL